MNYSSPSPNKKASGTSPGYIQNFQKQRLASLQICRITDSQIFRTHGLIVFLGPFSVLGTFWSKTLPKPWRVPKNQRFGAKTLEGLNKTKRTKISGHWVAGQLKTPKLFLFFLRPFLHQNFGFLDLSVFRKAFQYNVANTKVLAALLLRSHGLRGIF